MRRRPAFTKATGYPVRFSYGGSDTLVAQLLQGAPADVFVSANQLQMQRAIEGGAVVAPRSFARNRLVIIVPAGDTTVADRRRSRQEGHQGRARRADGPGRELRATDVRQPRQGRGVRSGLRRRECRPTW